MTTETAQPVELPFKVAGFCTDNIVNNLEAGSAESFEEKILEEVQNFVNKKIIKKKRKEIFQIENFNDMHKYITSKLENNCDTIDYIYSVDVDRVLNTLKKINIINTDLCKYDQQSMPGETKENYLGTLNTEIKEFNSAFNAFLEKYLSSAKVLDAFLDNEFRQELSLFKTHCDGLNSNLDDVNIYQFKTVVGDIRKRIKRVANTEQRDKLFDGEYQSCGAFHWKDEAPGNIIKRLDLITCAINISEKYLRESGFILNTKRTIWTKNL